VKETRTLQGKIIQHSEGMGVPSPELVRKRARELASINGREEVNQDDWIQAKRELHGGHHVEGDDEEDSAQFVSERDMVVPSSGHHSVKIGFEDSDNVVEELVAEGMDEAVHERMLEASRPPDEDLIDGL
jgi:hypothetical protein